MLVAAIMQCHRQPVRLAQRERKLGRSAPRRIFIVRIERAALGLRRLRGVVPCAQQVVEAVAEGTGLQRHAIGQLRAREEVDAVDVPPRPAPVLLDVDGIDRAERRILLAFLAGVAERVFVGRVRREASLDVEPPVLGAAQVARAAVLARRRGEAVRQVPVILEAVGEARLRVPRVLPGAEQAERGVAGVIGVAVEIEDAAQLGLERLRRLAGDEVDRAAHRAGAVEHRGIALGDLDLIDVRRQEAAVVEPVVGRQVDADAVDRQRYLEAVEAAHEEQPLVARAAGVRGGDAGQQARRIVQRVAVERFDRSLPQRVAADGRRRAGLALHDDLAEGESLRGGVIGRRPVFSPQRGGQPEQRASESKREGAQKDSSLGTITPLPLRSYIAVYMASHIQRNTGRGSR